jgi:hypothetical protein
MASNQVFIWHNNSEVSEIYESFIEVFSGQKPSMQIKLYIPDSDDALIMTRDEIIPSSVARSHSVIMLLSDKEDVQNPDFIRLIENIAFSPRPIVISPVFVRPAAKEWWSDNVSRKIEGLRRQCLEPLEIWSEEAEPAVLTGKDKDSKCVRLVEQLRKNIEAKVRELQPIRPSVFTPEWGFARGRPIFLLSSVGEEYSELETALKTELLRLSPDKPVVPIIWSGKWQSPGSQSVSGDVLKRPALFVRIVADSTYAPRKDVDLWRDIRTALGLSDIDFSSHWESFNDSLRLDWAPKAPRRLLSSEPGGASGNETNSFLSTSTGLLGISSIEVAHEIGRHLGVIKPAPPSVGYITIKMNSDRSKLVPNAEVFESNLQRSLRVALADVLRDRATPAEPELFPYHCGGYEAMIERAIQSGRVPIILADDLASSAQRPGIVEVLRLWEARIRTAAGNRRKPKEIIRGVLIYFHADDYKEVAQFPLEEIRDWYPLVIDDGGEIASSQLNAMTSAVSRAFPDAA